MKKISYYQFEKTEDGRIEVYWGIDTPDDKEFELKYIGTVDNPDGSFMKFAQSKLEMTVVFDMWVQPEHTREW